MDAFLTQRDNENYKKSNFLIGSKYKSSLLENKILALAFSKLDDAIVTTDGSITVYMQASEIIKKLNISSGSVYKYLDKVAHNMHGRTIGMSNPEKHEFCYLSIIVMSRYENGIFSIEFNRHLKNYLKDLQANYTKLNLETMLSFKSVYSFRLYELLKSRMYTPKGMEDTSDKYKIMFDLSELKLELGVINANEDKVKQVLNNTDEPDYDKAVEKAEEKSFNSWSEFKRRVIDVAVKEIIEKTPLKITYKTLKYGQGNKIRSVIFYVDKPQKNVDDEIIQTDISEEEKDNIIDSLFDMFEGKLKLKDIRTIATEGHYDYEYIKNKYEISKQSKIDNLVGWMINALREDYSENVKTKKETKSYADFEQREYDFDELEKQLLSRQ